MVETAPWSREAEVSVLGAAVIDGEVVDRLDDLPEEAFHSERNRHVWRAMRRIRARGDVVDATTVFDELQQSGKLEAAGGPEGLSELMDAVPDTSGAEDHARIIRDHHLRRRLMQLGDQLAREARAAPSGGAVGVLDLAESALLDLSEQSTRGDYVDGSTAMQEALERIEEALYSDRPVSGLSTGFADLDAKLDGLHPGELIFVGGRPSMGKTAFMLDICRHLLFEEEVSVGVFSLEMPRRDLAMRMAAAESALPLGRLRSGDVRDEEWQHLVEAAGRIKQAPLYIEDTASLPLHELRSSARRMVRREDVGAICVDYLQLMPGPEGAERREREVAELSRSLKSLARELEVPVVALSQLSRAPESRTDGRPRLSDLRESGAIEQDADVVLFVYRPEVYLGERHEGRDLRDQATIIVGKQRNGPTGDVPLRFDKSLVSFGSDPAGGVDR